MSGSHRTQRSALIALGMALFAIVLASWFSQPANGVERGENAGYSEQQQQDDVSRIVSAISSFDPWQDTYAQWVMAIFSFVATVFSVWAVFLVRDSLALNRDAVRIAYDAVGAERAWLTYLDCQFGPAMAPNENGEQELSIGFKVVWKNTGRSPATNLSMYTRYQIVFPNTPIPVFDPDKDPEGSISRTHIGPGEAIASNLYTFRPSDAPSIAHAIIYCRVQYEDIYSSNVRESEICDRVSVLHRKRPDGTVYQEFEVHPIGLQNRLT